MKKIDFKTDLEIISGYCEKVGKDVWIHLHGKTFRYEEMNSRKKRGHHDIANPNEIRAPMPGKITSLKKSHGDNVKVGDIVIVMEAMKMEYSLKANKEGKITIKTKDGEQVTLGQLLAEIQ